jgi:hypothetical protein
MAALVVLADPVQVRILAPQLKDSVREAREHTFVPRFDESELREAVRASSSLSDVLRHFGLRTAGGNHRLLRHWLETWEISIDHFARPPRPSRRRVPLVEVMVERSTYHRGHLKERLYAEGVKARRCELCGQGEEWRGRRMALILDHINGVADDHRLENLRSCVRTAPRRWTRIAAATWRTARALPAARRSGPKSANSATAPGRAVNGLTGRGSPSRRGAGWSGRGTSSWWPRSRRRAGVPWGGATA